MIWGNTARSLEKDETRKQKVVAISNERLKRWHDFFSWRKVVLLDGRFARFSTLDRKFIMFDNRPNSTRGVTLGLLDIREHSEFGVWESEGVVGNYGEYVYRERGSKDEVFEVSPSFAAARNLAALGELDEKPSDGGGRSVTDDGGGRRKAVLAQKARAQGDMPL